MKKPSIWKWLLLIGLVAWSLAVVFPFEEKITLGLDLRGGTSFVLEVDMSDLDEEQKRDAPERVLEVIRNRVDALGGTEPIIYLEPHSQRIVVQIPGLEQEDYQRTVDNLKRAAFLEFKLVHEDSAQLVNDLFAAGDAPLGYKIVTSGPDRFLVRDVENTPEGVTEQDVFKARRSFKAPPNSEMMLIRDVRGGSEVFTPVYVERRRQMTGQHVADAGVQQDTSKMVPTYVVSLRFEGEGKERFTRVTTDYSPFGDRNPSQEGRQLGIVLDGTLYSAPSLRTAIYSGSAQIEGNFSFEDAQDLALVIRAGSLPAPVQIIEERTVDPTLGKKSISSGLMAIMLGGLAVLLFMPLYYLLAGAIADIALLLDLVLLPAGMIIAAGVLNLISGSGTWSGPVGLPTLTLAGFAGIVLTIGMAVDANVLIFERIREEQVAGKRYKSAIDAGYDKVFSTIFDANFTTLLTAVILFWQGSGPIRGFAITLSAGILVSMYVALVVTRMCFDLIGSSTNISQVKMLTLLRNTSIDFLGKRKISAVLSLLVILISWGMFAQRGKDNFGVDFTGGVSITYEVQAESRPDANDLLDYLSAQGLSAHLQFQREMSPKVSGLSAEYLKITVPFEQGDQLNETIQGKYSKEVLDYKQTDSVGSQVGKELRKKGILSILWALVGIVVYISFRFEFGFAMGAIVALVHDVLITIGLYCLFGRELSLPIVAALLTIVGYSVNDTIVVFDRIREDMKLHKNRSYIEIANLSINQTLSRTVLTSVTTLLTVIMLLIFGGGAINDFALALLIGILVGTYSSIFVATPMTTLWHREEAPSLSKAK